MAPDDETEPSIETPEGALADPPRQPVPAEAPPEGLPSSERDATGQATDGVYADLPPDGAVPEGESLADGGDGEGDAGDGNVGPPVVEGGVPMAPTQGPDGDVVSG